MLVLLAALTAAPAHALELRFWGVGPTAGTMLFPGEYPLGVPSIAKEADKKTLKIERVGGDVELGVRGILYPGPKGRLSARLDHGFGTNGFSRNEFVVGYDKVFWRDEELQVLVGGGAGVGGETFPGTGAHEKGYLSTTYYPIRVEGSALLRLGEQAVEVGAHLDAHLGGTQRWYSDTGATPKEDESFEFNDLGRGIAVAVEATYYFGDFTPPGQEKKKHKEKKGRGGKGKKNRDRN